MERLSLNTLSPSVFKINSSETADLSRERADIVATGRLLAYEHARRGQSAIAAALKTNGVGASAMITEQQYAQANEKFQINHLLYAAKKACEASGTTAPESFEDFKRQGMSFYKNSDFLKVLQGIYQEIVSPILPRVYSEAVSVFADVVEVGFAETYQLSIGSDDIPVFQDSAWGASRSVPANRFYSKDITLNPQPKTAEIRMKWHQLVGNGTDFGRFFANLAAGMYAKTMGMFAQILTNLATDTTKIPSALSVIFGSTNWVKLANRLSALNNVNINNLLAFGNVVGLSKVLPTQQTGSTNVNMDAALATLLGADYIRSGYLGEYMGVKLLPLIDAVVPGTQNSSVTTVLDETKIWMMASAGRKPLTICYNSATPLTIELSVPVESGAAFELVSNVTMALDMVAVVVDKIGVVTIG